MASQISLCTQRRCSRSVNAACYRAGPRRKEAGSKDCGSLIPARSSMSARPVRSRKRTTSRRSKRLTQSRLLLLMINHRTSMQTIRPRWRRRGRPLRTCCRKCKKRRLAMRAAVRSTAPPYGRLAENPNWLLQREAQIRSREGCFQDSAAGC